MPWTKAGRERRARVEEATEVMPVVKDMRDSVRNTQVHTAAVASLLSTQNTELAGHRAGLAAVVDEVRAARAEESERWKILSEFMGRPANPVTATPIERGRFAFETYARHAGNTAVTGHQIPAWDDLGNEVQGHWMAVAGALDHDR